jgi:hypothetical protein
LKYAITCDEEKDPSGNSEPMMSMEDGKDLESLPPPKKIKLTKLLEFGVVSHAKVQKEAVTI